MNKVCESKTGYRFRILMCAALVVLGLVVMQRKQSEGKIGSPRGEEVVTSGENRTADLAEDAQSGDRAENGGLSNEGEKGSPNERVALERAELSKSLVSKQKPFSIVKVSAQTRVDPVVELGIPLEPRTAHPPKELMLPPGSKHRIAVKFVDQAVARLGEGNQVSVLWEDAEDLSELSNLVSAHQLVAEPVFPFPEEVTDLRKRAAARSGKMQADLNGTVHLSGDIESNKLLAVAKLLQSSPLIESVDIDSLDMPPPPPSDIAPTTPSLVGLQGHRGLDPGFGIDYLWNLGVKGANVRFTDCEYGFNANHEDLMDSGITDISGAAVNPSVATNGWDEHGTAAMGLIVAGDNGYGVSGMAPECESYFSSEWTTQGYNRSRAVQAAVSNSVAGDVILLEMQTGGQNGEYVVAEYNSTIWNITKTATDAGIIVVAAAGNGDEDLDDAFYQSYMNRGDSGAIVVGAGSSTTQHYRYSYSTYGSRVDVQAWGGNVLTTGYGSYAKYGGDDNQSYSNFSGTSSASACTAGVVVLLQSYAKNILETTFTPEEMRAHLKAFGHAQLNEPENIGSAVALNLAIPELPDRPMSMTAEASGTNDITLSFWGLPFRKYKIMKTSELGPLASWDDFRTGLDGDADVVQINLPAEVSTAGAGFYQLEEEGQTPPPSDE